MECRVLAILSPTSIWAVVAARNDAVKRGRASLTTRSGSQPARAHPNNRRDEIGLAGQSPRALAGCLHRQLRSSSAARGEKLVVCVRFPAACNSRPMP